MAENVTTLLDKWQKQRQDHPDWVPALEDILYVIHGTVSDRDRVYTLEQVRDLIQGVFELIHMEKNGSQLDADGEKLIVTKSTQGGNYTAKLDKDGMIVGFPTIGYIRYGLRKIEFLAADGTTKVGEFSLDNGKFKFDKSVNVTGDVNATGPIKSSGGAVVGKSLQATAGGVQATGDISTSNGNLSGKNVNATGNIKTTNGNVSASGDVTAKNGKAVLSGMTGRPSGLWMNDGASSNRKEASVAMDPNGMLHISGDAGVEIGGQLTFNVAGYPTLHKPCTMAVGAWSPGYSALYPLIATNQDVDLTTYTNYPNCTVLTIVNTKDGGITVTCTNNETDDIPKGGFSTYLRYGVGWYFHAGRT